MQYPALPRLLIPLLAAAPLNAAELLYNGDFSSVTSPWILNTDAGSSATLAVSSGQAFVDITAAGSSPGDVRLEQALFADLVGGTRHTISFVARASSARTLDITLHDSSGAVLWSKTGIAVGAGATSYAYEYTPSVTHTGAYLSFGVGGSAADVYLDNVSLASSERLAWGPPLLDDPLVLKLGASNTVPELTSGRDYLIQLPSTPRTKRVQIKGGRNVVVVGGHVDISTTDNAFYVLEGDSGRTVHIEGALVTHSGVDAQGDAFGINAPTSVVQIENVRVEHLQGAVAETHSDVIQPWGGTLDLRVDHLSGSGNYQGFFLIANYNRNHAFTFKNVNLVIEPEWYAGASGGDVIWLDRGLSGDLGGPVPTVFANFHAVTRAGDTLPYAVAPSPANTDPTARPALADGVLTWPGLAFVSGGIHDGPPPAGDYVPSGRAGIGYAPAGYADLMSEVEDVAAVSASDTVTLYAEPNASNGADEKLSANAVGDYVAYTLPNIPAGTYDISVGVKTHTSRGQYQLDIDGTGQGDIQDQYATSTGYAEQDLGSATFPASGDKVFTFTVTGKNAASPGYSLMFDYIRLTPRLPRIDVREAEGAVVAAASPSVSAVTDSSASGGAAQKLNATATGHYVRYILANVPAGIWRIKVGVKTYSSRGIFQLDIDGTAQGAAQDSYGTTVGYTEFDLGTKTFATAADRDFTFTITGKNAASSGYDLVFDYIKLVE